jgi:hypothetical protein
VNAGARVEQRSIVTQLALTVAGVLLLVGSPYIIEILNLASRLQNTIIAVVELISVVVGFVLLYLAFRKHELS